MGKSIETVFIELYISEYSKPPSSGSIYQDLNIELSKMGTEELEKQRACTKMKLRECELYSENSAITFGLPIASFVFSVISILVSYGTIIASCLLTAILVGPVIGIAGLCEICQVCVNNRKKQAMYHKDKLEIINALLKERNREGNCHANV